MVVFGDKKLKRRGLFELSESFYYKYDFQVYKITLFYILDIAFLKNRDSVPRCFVNS